MLSSLACTARARAIENLNCKPQLKQAIDILPGIRTTIGHDEVVIRGPLEANLQLSPVLLLRFMIQDAEGFDQIFPLREDSMHALAPGDRVFLIGKNGRLFMHGYYNHTHKLTMVDWTGEFQELNLPHPQLFEDREFKVPRLAIDRFAAFFNEGREAVVIKKLSEEILERLRQRLNPQVARYLEHRKNPARFVQIAPNRAPYEMRLFEMKFEGQLKDEYPDFPKLTKHGTYPVSLRLWRDLPPLQVRSGDRLFVLDDAGLLLKEFKVGEYPVAVRMFGHEEETHQLLEAMGYAGRTILIRQVGRTEER